MRGTRIGSESQKKRGSKMGVENCVSRDELVFTLQVGMEVASAQVDCWRPCGDGDAKRRDGNSMGEVREALE